MKKKDRQELEKYYNYFYKGGNGNTHKRKYNLDEGVVDNEALDTQPDECYTYNREGE